MAYTTTQKRAVLDAYCEGKSYRTLEKEFGIRKTVIQRWAKVGEGTNGEKWDDYRKRINAKVDEVHEKTLIEKLGEQRKRHFALWSRIGFEVESYFRPDEQGNKPPRVEPGKLFMLANTLKLAQHGQHFAADPEGNGVGEQSEWDDTAA